MTVQKSVYVQRRTVLFLCCNPILLYQKHNGCSELFFFQLTVQLQEERSYRLPILQRVWV